MYENFPWILDLIETVYITTKGGPHVEICPIAIQSWGTYIIVMGVSNHSGSIKATNRGKLCFHFNVPRKIFATHRNNISAQKLNRKQTFFKMRSPLHTLILNELQWRFLIFFWHY